MLDKRDNFDDKLKERYDNIHADLPEWNELFSESELINISRAAQQKSLNQRTLLITAVAALIIAGLFWGNHFITDNTILTTETTTTLTNSGVEVQETKPLITATIDQKNRSKTLNKPAKKAIINSQSTHITTTESKIIVPDTIQQSTGINLTRPKEKNTKPKEKSTDNSVQTLSQRENHYKKRDRVSLVAATSIMSSAGSSQTGGEMAMYAAPMPVNINSYRSTVNFNKDEYKHKFPVSVAVAVKYELLDRFSISSGLNYSYLESTAETTEKLTYSLTQRVNYLGVPLSLNYDFLKLERFSMYGLVGGMVEFNIGATNEIKSYSKGTLVSTQKDKINTNNSLFSLQCGVGAKYNIVEKFGIFVEPGINYVFNNASQPITYRTKTPLQFNLRVGLIINL